MFPLWLHILSIVTLLVGAGCALAITTDVTHHPQHMWIMNVVWPVTALFGGPITLWLYRRFGRLATHAAKHAALSEDSGPHSKAIPFAVKVAKGAGHCGSGCTIGDILAEWLAFLVPGVAVWFGWGSLFGDKMFAVWVLDYVFAFVIGVAFQYFTIAPMRGLGFWPGLVAALKADTLSLTAWQVGMYGFMAIAQFILFGHFLGHRAAVDTPEFWFAMQIAMIAGFCTSYPVNWWLVRTGVKEAM